MSRIRNGIFSPVAVIFFAWLSALVSRLVKHGSSFGLNYNLLQPDGALYHALTLRILGHSWAESNGLVNQYFQNQIGVTYLPELFDRSTEKVILTRPLYSLLSTPFVWLFGQGGMFVVPALSLLAVGLISLKYFEGRTEKYVASGVFGLLTLSTSITRWFFSDLTDGILVLMVAAAFLVLIKHWPDYLLLIVTALALATRPSGPIMFALLLPFFFKNRSIARIVTLLFAFIGTVALSLVSPEAAGTQTTGEYTVANRVSDFPVHFLKVLVVEFGQLFVLDRILFILVMCSLLIAIRNFRAVIAQSYLLLVSTAFLLGAWNGALGVNFRYQLSILPILIYLVSKQLSAFLIPESKTLKSLL